MTAEALKKQMSDDEWQTVYDMSQDKNLYQNFCSSLFPTIHGMSHFSFLQYLEKKTQQAINYTKII